MLRRIAYDLRQSILNYELGLLGRHKLAHVHYEDKAAVASQQVGDP